MLGVEVGTLFTMIQAYLSSIYINNYNKYGQVYQVNLMAEGAARSEPEDLARLRVVTSDGRSVPFGELMDIRYTTGPVNIPRYNLYTSTQIIGGPAPGYSGGDAIKALAKLQGEVLEPNGFGGEWTGMVYQQIIAGSYTSMIFLLGLVTIFLILASLYESWAMPLMILLAVPLAVLGAISALAIRSMPLDIYGQIGLLMLIGLAAKNAILIVEFARELRIQGRSILEAAVEAARLRLRPILMTALAFILGVLLVFAREPAGARHPISTTVLGGMLASTFRSSGGPGVLRRDPVGPRAVQHGQGDQGRRTRRRPDQEPGTGLSQSKVTGTRAGTASGPRSCCGTDAGCWPGRRARRR